MCYSPRMRNEIASREEWLVARKAHLAEEKEFTHICDRLSARRRALPWVRVDKEYTFDGVDGRQTLADLFDGKSQLIIYHLIFDPAWEEGCKGCSLLADSHDGGTLAHLEQRDVAMVTVSRAPLAKLQAFRKCMGWRFKWASSTGNNFNHDFRVTFTAEEVESGAADHNYGGHTIMTEVHGVGVFCKNDCGEIFHTCSTYARGVDMLINTYYYLDLLPKGRDEDRLRFTMEWLRLRDSCGGDG